LRAISAADGLIARRGVARSVGLAPARADRELRRACAPVLFVPQEALDDPVLERVERDHRRASRPASISWAAGRRALERAELVVDLDSERLEDALRRMPLAEGAPGSGSACLTTSTSLARPLEGLLAPALTRSHARICFA
jgi:hypothetical protein